MPYKSLEACIVTTAYYPYINIINIVNFQFEILGPLQTLNCYLLKMADFLII